jgi:hypothetical protein
MTSFIRSAAAASVLAATIWPGRAGTIPYSFIATFTGTCDETDQAEAWKVRARGLMEGNKIGVWTDEPIRVFAFEILQLTGGPSLYWAIESGHFGGTRMMWLPPGARHGYKAFPPGIGIPIMGPPDPGKFFRLHGGCYGGGQVEVYVTIYFTKDNGL